MLARCLVCPKADAAGSIYGIRNSRPGRLSDSLLQPRSSNGQHQKYTTWLAERGYRPMTADALSRRIQGDQPRSELPADKLVDVEWLDGSTANGMTQPIVTRERTRTTPELGESAKFVRAAQKRLPQSGRPDHPDTQCG
jgi:hypothetical protein